MNPSDQHTAPSRINLMQADLLGGGFGMVDNPMDQGFAIAPLEGSLEDHSDNLQQHIINSFSCSAVVDLVAEIELHGIESFANTDDPEEELYFTHSDHLGSASFITDASGEAVQHLQYLPFGEHFVSQTSSSWESRYTFSGKEKDTETGYSYFGARYYDADLSVFLSVDRFTNKYPSLTPYQYAGNNPVILVDINGDSLWITHNTGFLGIGGKQTLRYDNGNLYNKDGSKYEGKVKGFLSKAVGALNRLNSTETGENMVEEIEDSQQNVFIKKSNEGNYYDDETNTIGFDVLSTEGGLNTQGNTTRPSFIGLGHELAHGLDDIRGSLDSDEIPGFSGIAYAELFATHMENLIRAENFLPLRTHYGIDAKGNGILPIIDSKGNSLNFDGVNYNQIMMSTFINNLKR